MARSSDTSGLKLRQGIFRLRHLLQALALVWRAARSWTVAWALLLVVQGVLPVVTIYLVRSLVDSLVATLQGDGDWAALYPSVVLIAMVAGVMLLSELLRSAAGLIKGIQAEHVRDYVSALVHEKAVAADMAMYESPAYHDQLHRARVMAAHRPLSMLETVGSVLQNSITFVAMLAVLMQFGVWVPLALVGSAAPALLVLLHYHRRQHDWTMRRTSDERRTHYYDLMLTSRAAAAELRVFHLGGFFKQAFQALRRVLRAERLALSRRQLLGELAVRLFALLVLGAALVWMVLSGLKGPGALGSLTLFYQAFSRGQQLTGVLMANLGKVYENCLFLENLFEFLATEPQVTDPPEPRPAPTGLSKEIRFDGVTFYYPDSDKPVLHNFDLVVPAGSITAIVGANGAGKSTLIKLLCRFYDPDNGVVRLDGVDVRDFRVEEFRSLISVLFQQPMQYNATVAENIAFGNQSASPTQRDIQAAAMAAGVHHIISRLTKGYDTLLGKSFLGGTDLSVGEWQRIALARAFLPVLQARPIIILDEPTSAMDSWAEADWLERFRDLAAGHTSLVITHRFTTARYADTIHVMIDGRIVESGSHEELLKLDGRYASSWHEQHKRVSPAQTD